jgi:hypothetical protein
MTVYQCQHCNEQLPYYAHTISPYCEKPHCQRAKVQHHLSVTKKQIISGVTNKVTRVCNEYLNIIDDTNHQIKKENQHAELNALNSENVVIFPVNVRSLVMLSEQRKNDFLSHLKTVYTDIIEKRPASSKIYTTQLNQPLNKEESQLLGKACATCKGQCCGLGDDHAYQDTASLGYFLESQSNTLNLEEITQLYSQYFPSEIYQNACVFQGNMGCTLPTELRSFTCNNYQCSSLRSYHQKLTSNEQKLTIIAATEERDIKHISIIDEHTFLIVK